MVGRASEAYGAETTKPAMPPKRGTEPETQLLLQHVQGCLKRKLQANAANKSFCLFLLHSGLACVGKKVTELRGCVVTQSGKKKQTNKKTVNSGTEIFSLSMAVCVWKWWSRAALQDSNWKPWSRSVFYRHLEVNLRTFHATSLRHVSYPQSAFIKVPIRCSATAVQVICIPKL